MSGRRSPDPAYLRALEIELFVPHRLLPGAAAHPLYEIESPRRKSRRWIEGLQKSQKSAPQPKRAARDKRRAQAPAAPKPRMQRICIAGLYFPDCGVFAADSLGADGVLPALWRPLLKNILFACGAPTPVLPEWPEALTPKWNAAADADDKEACDFMGGATGCNRVPAQDCLLLFGAAAGRFLQPRPGQTCIKIGPSLTRMLEQPERKAEAWAQLQDFRNWALLRRS